jgi:uncharacterized protein (DUF58 family)
MLRAGPGSGFREHRGYSPGDPLRRVDWNVYARMNTLVVKEFDAEEALDFVCVQDRSLSMRGAAALCAAKVCAAIGAIGLAHLDSVHWIPTGPGRGAESFRGRGRVPELLEAVAGEAAGGTVLLHAVRAHLPRAGRGGVAFGASDFFDPLGATLALSCLLARRYRVRAVLIEDVEALAPPPLGRYRMIDAETGESLKIDVTPDTIEAYRRTRIGRVRGLHAFCRQRGIGFLRARADQPFFEIVRAALARGWLTR